MTAPALRWLRLGLLGPAAALAMGRAAAQFSVAISPPRLELDAPAGQTVRSVIELTNASAAAGNFRVYTNDWTLADDGKIEFKEELAADSCRPWVAIERRQVSVAAGARMRYRIEVAPPAGAASRECRFAVMFEGSEEGVESGPVKIPMSGRVGVIVYVRVGDVRAELRVERVFVAQSEGRPVPALAVFNAGQATSRFFGFVTAELPGGAVVDLAPNSVPVLPGMRRTVELLPLPPADRPGDKPPELRWPLRVRGTLESSLANSPKTGLDATLDSGSR
jgi:hypothetical protein